MNRLVEEAKTVGINLTQEQCIQLNTYKILLIDTNKFLNLTAIDDDEGVIYKHFLDSMLISPQIPQNSTLVDVGSGAGFPGMVLAIVRPDIHVTCVEPTAKRTNFLSEVSEACGIENVTILTARAEDIIETYREHFDVATARAVAYLDILSELCLPFVKVGGKFIAMKGQKGEEEYNNSKKAIHLLGGEKPTVFYHNHPNIGERYNLEIKKISRTPRLYPRSYAKIKKTPLSGRK